MPNSSQLETSFEHRTKVADPGSKITTYAVNGAANAKTIGPCTRASLPRFDNLSPGRWTE
eukprot:1882695-Rhodomonas_salina.2